MGDARDSNPTGFGPFGKRRWLGERYVRLSIHSLIRRATATLARRAVLESVAAAAGIQVALLLSGALSARLLGVRGRGYLALLMLLPNLLVLIGGLGLPQAATFYIANRGGAHAIFGSLKRSLKIQLVVLTLLHVAFVVVFLDQSRQEFQLAGWVTVGVTPALLLRFFGLSFLQGTAEYRLFNVSRLLPPALYAIGVLALFLGPGADLVQVTLVWTVANVIAGGLTALMGWRAIQRQPIGDVSGSSLGIGEMIRFGLRGLIGWSSPLDSFKLDQLFAGLILSPIALGYYVAAQAFVNLPRSLAQSVAVIAFPNIARRAGENMVLRRSMWHFIFVVGIVSAIVVLLLCAAVPYLVPLFFGRSFTPAVPLARILLLGGWALAVRRILVECARGLGYPVISSYTELFIVLWMVGITLLLISNLGVIGLSIGVATGQGAALLFGWALVARIWPRV